MFPPVCGPVGRYGGGPGWGIFGSSPESAGGETENLTHTRSFIMNAVARRIAAGIVLAAAPALIALGTAAASSAQTQDNAPQPGTSVHHHHQHNGH
jgi:hypothetical protein